ncbi:nuclear fragile X mental retardation-interacting protein 1-like [Dendronephthya gigantea]|uniref:nuclear fragile X mental retardation-interacting protein 1-like n=1 Tax=Dendronephthya gigantea TaxID=151771 RepID=UPI00106D9FDF|nr:nuclear fragile X mental retardation-interacting protein 1-like [Dendronephthya gigantea]XP_028403182.1 nuclear fragile X mental retardation-interacting protein 1-like [Dendronephthya gigantea]
MNALPNFGLLSANGIRPFHSSIIPPQISRSFNIGTTPPMVLNGFNFQQPCQPLPKAVQQYLDVNHNESSQNQGKQNMLSPNSSFQCVPCKKLFQDQNSLRAHSKAHVKCEFPNCSFIASRQSLKLHEIQCHREGKMKIILNTPEQIFKWREERRRNYPTVTNMARKEAEQQDRVKSGHTVRTKGFRYNRKQGWKQQRRNAHQKRNSDVPSTELPTNKLPNKDLPTFAEQNEKCTFQNGNLPDSSSGCNEKQDRLLNLSSLAASYASSSSDENENDGNSVKQTATIAEKPLPSKHCAKFESKKRKLMGNVNKITDRKENQDRRKKKRKENKTGPNRARPTILEMLLASDIRHERNVMLQCVRFIVKRNFFGAD